MKSYHNVALAERKHKKHSTEKSNNENEKNGLRIEFSMAWYFRLDLHTDLKGFSVNDWTLEEMNLY